jgi:5-methylcytosine-specific restriction enzyme subunit McrC
LVVSKNHITVFEHEILRAEEGSYFDSNKLKELQLFYGTKGVPFFNLIHNGIKFCEYVGVLQVGKTTIEVLPKADKKHDERIWRKMLIGMLRTVGVFDIHAPSSSILKLKPNSILDLYFEFFIDEVEFLLHSGLIKQYRKTEGNTYSLKGSLQFGKHIQQNHVHQERFYVRSTTFDHEHKLHFILYKTIRLISVLNTNHVLQSRIGALLLFFPEMLDIKVTDETFCTITYNRKTIAYQRAIEIARLLLLHYHPDVSRGQNDVLALMFDMNKLWEKFVLASIRKNISSGITLKAQPFKYFWKSESGKRTKMEPDIIINPGDKDNCFVIDTKWKNLNGKNPSPDDLRQMYVYHEYFGAKKVALVYPGELEEPIVKGKYLDKVTGKDIDNMECSTISLKVNEDINKWQQVIFRTVEEWMSLADKIGDGILI